VSELTLAQKNQGRDKACPQGEHLTKTAPVVCVPNKNAETREPGAPFPEFPIDVPTFAVMIFGLAVVVFLVAKLLGWWRGRRATPDAIEGQPASGLPAGALMNSPSLGWGDLHWGSPSLGFLVPQLAVGHHIIIGGGTGSGKSNSAEVLEHAAATTYRPQIIHFDCKGSRDGMARFVALMAAAGIAPERVRLFPAEPYDGWRGGSDPERALFGRLVQVQDWSESFYEAATKDLLQRVLFDVAPPSGSAEFLTRLEKVPPGANAKLTEGALTRYRGFFRSLKGSLDGSWAFEDCDACYIQLEGFGLPSEAVTIGRFLLEDLTHYLADRKTDKRPVLVVLDEFSAISTGADAANMVERAREFGAGVILTTQSYAGLGRNAERVLDAARGALIIHSVANPEPFTSRAGTVWRPVQAITEPTHQPGVISSILFNTKPPETPRKTTREQEFPRIDPNEVRQLPRGEAFVISGGRAQRVSFNRIELWNENIELARSEIDRRRRGAPATSSGNGHAPPPATATDDDPDLDF
jgi:hypothetical protein